MFHTTHVTTEMKTEAQNLLSLTRQEQINHWLTHVAPDLDYGHYLKTSTEKSRRQRFSNWHKKLTAIANAEVGAEIYP